MPDTFVSFPAQATTRTRILHEGGHECSLVYHHREARLPRGGHLEFIIARLSNDAIK